MADIARGVLLDEPRSARGPTMVEMREFTHQRWRLWALGRYCDLLIRLMQRHGVTAGLAGRIERAIAEAKRTQLWLDQKTDAFVRRDGAS